MVQTSPKCTVMRRLAVILLLSLLPAVLTAEDPGFLVVVHADNPTRSVTTEQLQKFFLQKTTRWDNGVRVVPIDLHNDHPTREAFTMAVFGKDVDAIESYWQRMIFSGRDVPPQKFATVKEVLAFIRETPGGIGYVSPTAELSNWVRALEITEGRPPEGNAEGEYRPPEGNEGGEL